MGYTYFVVRKLKTKQDFDAVETTFSRKDKESLYEDFLNRVEELPWYKNENNARGHKLRTNGIKAILLECIYKEAETVDFDSWREDVTAWIRLKYVCSERSILATEWKRLDKDGGVVRALIIPITPDQKISCYYYFPSVYTYGAHCADYMKAVGEKYHLHGAPHGVAGAAAKRDLAYANGKSMPAIDARKETEDQESYEKRISDAYSELYMEKEAMKTELSRERKLNEELKEFEDVARLLAEYTRFTKQYGETAKIKAMLNTARRLQYGIRSLQESGNKQGIQYVESVLKAGGDYMTKHGIPPIS